MHRVLAESLARWDKEPVGDFSRSGLEPRPPSHPGGDHAADLGGKVGLTEGLPPRFHGTGELVEEMPDPAAAAGQVKGQVRTDQGSAHAQPIADRGVDVRNRGNPLGDEMNRLTPQRSLQPVGDVSWNLATDVDRPLRSDPGNFLAMVSSVGDGRRGATRSTASMASTGPPPAVSTVAGQAPALWQGRSTDCTAPSFSSHHEAACADLEKRSRPSAGRRPRGAGTLNSADDCGPADLPPKKWTGLGRQLLGESWAEITQSRV